MITAIIDSTWTNWETAATKTWSLSKGDGSKWVKVQVRNEVGITSASTFDTIILKTR